MKRLLIGAAAAALFAVFAVGASASPPATWHLSFAATPSTLTAGDSVHVSGMLTDRFHHGVGGEDVAIKLYANSDCSGLGTVTFMTTSDVRATRGAYAGDIPIATAGTYSMKASYGQKGHHVDTACVALTVTAGTPEVTTPPRGEDSVFLCYSAFQVDPGVWTWSVAHEAMLGGGYWLPYAVKGNVAFGTNIGAYHLVCNIATTQSATGTVVGAGGETLSASEQARIWGDQFGAFYPEAGAP